MDTKLRKVRCNEKSLCFGCGCGDDAGDTAVRLQGRDNGARDFPAEIPASHADALGQPKHVAVGVTFGQRNGHWLGIRFGLGIPRGLVTHRRRNGRRIQTIDDNSPANNKQAWAWKALWLPCLLRVQACRIVSDSPKKQYKNRLKSGPFPFRAFNSAVNQVIIV